MRKPHLILTTLSLCAASASFIVPALAQDTTNTQNTSERPIVYPSASIANFQPLPLNEVLLSVDVVTSEEIERSTASSVSELIAQKTGIEFSRTGGPGAVTSHFLRGQGSKNYIMLVDGTRVHTNALGSLLMPEISVAQIEKIELLKGNASALYGEAAVGGVINIITKSGSLRDSGFISTKYGSYDTAEVSAGVSKYVNGFNLSFAGTKFETEGFDVQTASATNPDKDGYSNASYDFKVERRLSPNAKLAFGLYNSDTEADYDDSLTVPSGTHEYETKNKNQFVDYEFKRGRLVNLHLKHIQTERIRKDFIDGKPASVASIYRKDKKTGKREDTKLLNILDFMGADGNTLHSFTQGLELSNSYFDEDGTRTDRDNEAGFLGYLRKSGSHSVQANIRQDSVSLKSTNAKDFDEFSYLAGYGYEFGKYYKIAFSHATGFRAPDATAFNSDPSLVAENHTTNELSLQRTEAGQFWRMTLFSTKADNALLYNPNTFVTENVDIENQGLEFNLQGSTNIFEYDLDITLQDPKRKDLSNKRKTLPRRAKSFGRLTLSKQLGDYQIGSSLTYSGRKRDSDFSDTEIASFTRLDGYISRQLGDNLSVNLKAENITNSEYETTAGYRTP
ncbi:MAG: TonB-dependent receptor, partial [Alphaproteobacteria bacterium]|nr:TonB-dependent receptor [Alphaproteobacteria bacterium]